MSYGAVNCHLIGIAMKEMVRRALEVIRSEVADLTVLATQKVTGKILTADDHKRLIDEAIGELDFSALQQGSPN